MSLMTSNFTSSSPLLKVLERQVDETDYLEVAEFRVGMGTFLQKVAKEPFRQKGERFNLNPRGRQPFHGHGSLVQYSALQLLWLTKLPVQGQNGFRSRGPGAG